MRRFVPAFGFAVTLLLGVPFQAVSQSTTVGGEDATSVHSADGVQVLKVPGPEINARDENYPGVHLEWYVAQDSSLGLVFRKPSGLKIDSNRGYDGDIDLRALEAVDAFEVKALTFDAWDQHAGTFQTTYRSGFEGEDERSFDPRWVDLRDEDDRHLTSIIYISRVRYPDGDITVANTDPIHHVAQKIDDSYTPQAEREEDLQELLELWRELLKRLQGWTPPGSVTSDLEVGEASGAIN